MSELHSAYDNVALTQTLDAGVSVNTRNEMDKHKSILLVNYDEEQQQEEHEEEEEEELTLINKYSNFNTDYQVKVEEIATQPHSPFHFASTAQFHNQLRRTIMMMVTGNDEEQNNHVTLYSTHLTAVDGMCHEWPELKKFKNNKNAYRLQSSKGNEAVNENNKKNKEKLKASGTSQEQSAREFVVTEKSNERENNTGNITMASLPSQELSLLHRVAINESVLSELIDAESEVTTLIVPEIHDTSSSIQEHDTKYSSPNETNSHRTIVESKDMKITSMRKIPSIREYVDNLKSSSLNSANVNTNTNRIPLKRKRVTSTRTSRNNEANNTSNLQKAEMQPQWQLLVDYREKFNGSHEQMVKLLERHCKCKVVSASLPIGDFVINVDMTSNKKAEEFTYEEREIDNDDKESATSAPETSSSPLLFSHLFPVVIERKTVEDVAASIKDGRYYEQRHLLQHGPFALLEEEEEMFTVSQIDEVWEVLSDAPDTVVDESKNISSNVKDKEDDEDEYDDDMCFRRLRSVIASLSSFIDRTKLDATSTPNTMVVRTKHIQESANFLSELAYHLMCSMHTTNNSNNNHELITKFTESGATAKSNCERETSHIQSVHLSFPNLLNTTETFRAINEQQGVFNARTAPVRMLMCIRGCSSTLACLLLVHYGTILNLWKRLTQYTNVNKDLIAASTAPNSATSHVDNDEIIQSLPISQKKIFVLLTEFLLAKEYLEARKDKTEQIYYF